MEYMDRLVARFRQREAAKADVRDARDEAAPADHTLLVRIPTVTDAWTTDEAIDRLFDLADAIETALDADACGYLDGEEAGRREFTVCCHGSDADRMWSVVRTVLDRHRLPTGTHALRWFGAGDDAPHDRIDIPVTR